MAKNDPILVGFNRGEISTQLLGRTDLEHLRLAAQIQENWQPRVLGPMSLRPGSAHIGSPLSTPAKLVPFVAQFDDIAVLELTGYAMRAWVGDALVTRASVATSVPGFSSGSWTVSRQTGTAAVSVSSGGLFFSSINSGAACAVDCPVSCGSPGVEHAIRVVVGNGPVVFRVGSSQGADDLFPAETLDTGTYSLAFTPAGNFWIEFASTVAPEAYSTIRQSQPQGLYLVYVDSIAIEAAGPMALPTPWPASMLQAPCSLRFAPSADVIFVAAPGTPQYQIVRYSVTSWSVVLYRPVKGPMNATPGDKSTVLSIPATSSAHTPTGNTVLNASQPFFTPDDVGTLFRLYHWRQDLTQTLSSGDTWTDAIRVTGVSVVSVISSGSVVDIAATDRDFGILSTGTWSGTLTLQRSFDGYTTGFNDYQKYTSNIPAQAITDSLNNEIVYYRIGFHGDLYNSGSATCTISYAGGGGEGVVHVTGYISPTQVNVEILVPIAAYGSAFDWRRSEWSPQQGYPTAVAIHEGRLWWSGSDRWWGSMSDDYTNFDFDQQGDASYIDIAVGQGAIADINWLLSIDNLLGGGDTQIIVARSDAIQTPLTPTNFNLRFSTTQGSAPIQAVKIDNKAIFVNQSGRRIFIAVYDLYTYNYKAVELSNLNPDIGGWAGGGFVGMAVQRNPDTIINLIRADGQLVCLLYDADDDVKAFWRKTTLGNYLDVIVLPGTVEDQVYVQVQRAGGTFIEKFARLDECFGDSICKLVDSHVVYQGAATASISAPWLAWQQVAVWANGFEVYGPNAAAGLLTLDGSGNGTLPEAVTPITFGIPYEAQYLGTKLAYGAQQGTAINEKKRVDHIGFVLQNTHYQGLQYGAYVVNPVRNASTGTSDFMTAVAQLWDNGAPIDDLPLVEEGMEVPAGTIWAQYDFQRTEFAGDCTTDSRLYLRAQSPRPATVVAVTFSIASNG